MYVCFILQYKNVEVIIIKIDTIHFKTIRIEG